VLAFYKPSFVYLLVLQMDDETDFDRASELQVRAL